MAWILLYSLTYTLGKASHEREVGKIHAATDPPALFHGGISPYARITYCAYATQYRTDCPTGGYRGCQRSPADRVADAITRFGGSMAFVYVHLGLVWRVDTLAFPAGLPQAFALIRIRSNSLRLWFPWRRFSSRPLS